MTTHSSGPRTALTIALGAAAGAVVLLILWVALMWWMVTP